LTGILDGILKAFELIFSGDPRVFDITLRSLYVSGAATLIAILWGVPIAMLLGLKNFHGKLLIKSIFSTLIGIPTVALGLILYLVLSRGGPLGFLSLLYTPTAIIIGEALLVTPIVVSFATTAIEAVDREIMNLAKTLGASESQASLAVLKEALNGVFLAATASFNRAIAELGVAILVGGGIRNWTQVLTTGIELETARGNLELAIALSIILLAIVFGINLAVSLIQRRTIWTVPSI
jgi:tungstate transport system permease protein